MKKATYNYRCMNVKYSDFINAGDCVVPVKEVLVMMVAVNLAFTAVIEML